MTTPDLGLTVPLHGVQLIEASAGTGKTFTVATLHARLVIEAGLPVASILAVTYTVAATAELRERLRERLQLALQLAEGANEQAAQASASTHPSAESSGLAPRVEHARRCEDANGHATAKACTQNAESAVLVPLVAAAREREGTNALIRRLRRAVEDMDLAPIHTIHAFCQRALAEHAVDAGFAPLRRELIANERGLREEVATEFWRAESLAPEGARALEAWSGPAALAELLRDVLAVDAVEPAPAVFGDDLDASVRRACETLAAAVRMHGPAARATLEQAMAAGLLHKQRFTPAKLESVWLSLDNWACTDLEPETLHENAAWLGSAQIAAKRVGKSPAPAPASPLFDAIQALFTAREACAARERNLRLALVHRLRDFGRRRLAQLKSERQLQGFDDLVTALAQALEGGRGEVFADRLRERYRAALVDEFQDTDARQEAIFHRLFAARALFLVGDPKQAIYRFRGGDVLSYLRARDRAARTHRLDRNFRSRPRALAAVQALFERAGEDAFAWEGIAFQPVVPGGTVHDADFMREAAPAPALTVQRLRGIDRKTSIDEVRERAAAACAAEVLALLQSDATVPGEDGLRAVQPGDIAVLIQRNGDAAMLRAALAALGIPSVAPGRESLYRAPEADELRWLLRALCRPGDEARLRGALATVLLGLDAAALEALGRDEAAQRAWQDRFQGWRQRAERHGPLGVVAECCAANAARLLQLTDGERRLGNYLQLAEALQEGQRGLGLDAILAELERRIESADPDNEEELPRLESDADRVTVLTLHKSKGLEWPFVFLPFLATGGGGGRLRVPPHVRVHEAGRQVLYFLEHETARDASACAREAAEERAEAVRLLYVGLTRARLATWLSWGPAKNFEKTALAWLLHRAPGSESVEAPDDARLDADLAAWQRAAPQAVDIVDAAVVGPAERWRDRVAEPAPPARSAQRALPRDWWIYSYSMLANEARNDVAHIEERGADDEVQAPVAPAERLRFAGARFGNSLHDALEHVQAERWHGWRGDEPPAGERAVLESALRGQGFGQEDDLALGVPLLAQLVRDTLNAVLPEGVCLAELPRAARRDELEFHFSLKSVPLEALLALLHAHGIVPERAGFGLRRRIEGLLTGRIDVVYEHGGRVFVLDYKSNRLPDYSAAGLEAAIRHGEYDLQYVLYTLALHRWLRFRLGVRYAYQVNFGGVRYLFCRGLEAGDTRGVYAVTPPFALIDALDRLFAEGAP